MVNNLLRIYQDMVNNLLRIYQELKLKKKITT
jgi:hypothetical protein